MEGTKEHSIDIITECLVIWEVIARNNRWLLLLPSLKKGNQRISHILKLKYKNE